MPDIRAGCVLEDEGRLVIAWEHLRSGGWLGMPLHHQTGPLHRAQLRLTDDETAALLIHSRVEPAPRSPNKPLTLLVDTRHRSLISNTATMLGYAGAELTGRIAHTWQRAQAASNLEHYERV